MALWQIQMTPLRPGFSNPATILFTCPITGIMPINIRPLVGIDKDEEHHEVLVNRQTKGGKLKLKLKLILFVIAPS